MPAVSRHVSGSGQTFGGVLWHSSEIAGRPTGHGTRREALDTHHVAVTALRAVTQRLAGEQQVAVAIVDRRFGAGHDGFGLGDQFATAGKFDRTITVGEEAVMPDPLQSIRKDMQQEATDELVGVETHDFLA